MPALYAGNGTDRSDACAGDFGVPVRPEVVSAYAGPPHQLEGAPTMLWTILIVLAIIALALFIIAQMRGRRGL
jgi:hypothetical protein